MCRKAQQTAKVEAWRNRQAGAQVSFAVTGNDGIDRQTKSVEPRCLAAIDHREVQCFVIQQIELENLGAARDRSDFLDTGRRHGRKRVACARLPGHLRHAHRSEEHTSELQSLMRISYAVFCLKKKK